MDRLDMCEAIKLHKIPFVLNPTNEWETFPHHLLEIVQNPWTENKRDGPPQDGRDLYAPVRSA